MEENLTSSGHGVQCIDFYNIKHIGLAISVTHFLQSVLSDYNDHNNQHSHIAIVLPLLHSLRLSFLISPHFVPSLSMVHIYSSLSTPFFQSSLCCQSSPFPISRFRSHWIPLPLYPSCRLKVLLLSTHFPSLRLSRDLLLSMY